MCIRDRFGKLGAPAMGVTGAAIATLVSQLLNLLLILIGFAAVSYTHLDVYKRQGPDKFAFAK